VFQVEGPVSEKTLDQEKNLMRKDKVARVLQPGRKGQETKPEMAETQSCRACEHCEVKMHQPDVQLLNLSLSLWPSFKDILSGSHEKLEDRTSKSMSADS
jgi:hypothetical protein